jgi:hypothetical protein
MAEATLDTRFGNNQEKLERYVSALGRQPSRPVSTLDLLPSERRFVAAIQQLGFGRYELIRIHGGQLVLDPWPTTVRHLKFGTAVVGPEDRSGDFELKKPFVEFFEYVRAAADGEIRTLEIRNGLPFSMEVQNAPQP